MHCHRHRILLAGALIALLVAVLAPIGGWAQVPRVDSTPASVVAPVDAAIAHAQSTIADAVWPAAAGLREVVQSAAPSPAKSTGNRVSPAAVALIVRWEVTSEARYTRSLQRPVWPGGASGITWGIGYDGGHQTTREILAAWAAHDQAQRLAGTAGLSGERARVALPAVRDIRTPYPLAYQVFADSSLPAYRASTRQAFRASRFDTLPPDAQGALVSLVYNRGTSFVGTRNAEKRAIRDECLPTADVRCIATQLRAMCWLWAGTPNGAGLCARRNDEARLAEAAWAW